MQDPGLAKGIQYVGKPPPRMRIPTASSSSFSERCEATGTSDKVQDPTLPVLEFLQGLPTPCDDLLPLLIEYGLKDRTTLLGFCRLSSDTQHSILHGWVEEQKISKFQRDLLKHGFTTKRAHTQL